MALGPDPGLDRTPALDATRSFHGGMNTRDHPILLNEFMSVALENVDVDRLGKVKRRRGVVSLSSPTAASEPWGMTLWHPPSARTERRLVGYWSGNANGIQLWQSRGDGAWTSFDTGVSLVLGLHQFQVGRAFYAAAHGSSSGVTIGVATLFAASAAPHDSGGSFPLSGLVFRHDITTETDRASQTFDVRPRCILWWQGRLWAFNSACTNHGLSWLGWSDALNGKTGYTDLGQRIFVAPDDGDEGTGLYAVRGESNLLYLWKRRSIWSLSVVWDTAGFYTESVDILDTTQSQLKQIATDVGCVATRSIAEVSLPDGTADVFFLAHDGIRSIRRAEQDTAGGAGRPITDGNDGLVERINFDSAHKAVARVHGNFYVLAVPLDGATDNSHQILIDLSKPNLPITVYTLGARDLADVELVTDDRRLYFQAASKYANDSGVTRHHVTEMFSGTEDPGGSAIPLKIDTRAYTHGDPLQLKIWDLVEIQAIAEGTECTLSIAVKIDEDSAGFTLVGHIPLETTANQFPVLPFNLPFSPSGGQSQIKALGLYGFRPGHQIEVRITDTTSFATVTIRNVLVAARPLPRQIYTI